MLLQILLGLVFWELFQLADDFAGNLLAFAAGNEIEAEHAGVERALVAVEGRAPWVFGIGRFAPGAVGPDNLHVAEIERGALRVGDVGAGLLVHKDAAGGTD